MFKDVQSSAATCSESAEPVRVLRLPAVINRVGLSRSSIYNRQRSGAFPRPVKLGPRAVGFIEQEIEAWICNARDLREEAHA
ncbi:AlpA family transcriptional regulator [Polaromonas sp.]|uniref:AlpA family transcriptional regulator n=1 Tax=Polaromonas sp. TaxID=1869339 RepID=UPI00352A9CB0